MSRQLALRRNNNLIDHVITAIENCNPQTSRTMKYALTRFGVFARCNGWAVAVARLVSLEAGEANIVADNYKQSLIQEKASASTINTMLTGLRKVCKIAKRYGLITWDLMVENVKVVAYKNTKGCGTDGFKDILRACNGTDPASVRDRAILRIMWDCGLRRGEIEKLVVTDYQRREQRLQIKGKARQESEYVPLPRPTIEAIDKWLSVKPEGDGSLFCSVDRQPGSRLSGAMLWKIVRKYGNIADVVEARPHGIRHAVCTHLLNAGEQLADVSAFMRHSDPKITMIYDDNRKQRATKLSKRASLIK